MNREAIGKLAYKINEKGTRPPPIQRELVDGSGIYQGDRVRITNPSKGQKEVGETFGVTKNKLVKVHIITDRVIRMLHKNLAKLNYYVNRSDKRGSSHRGKQDRRGLSCRERHASKHNYQPQQSIRRSESETQEE